jgi:hypothetical protein
MTTPATAAEPRKRRFHKPSLTQIGAIVALIGGILSLLFIFKPGWKPQPPPDVGTVKISDVKVTTPVTFRRFHQKLRLPVGTQSKEYLARRGVLIEFDYEAMGFRNRRIGIHWELIDARTNEPVLSDVSDDKNAQKAVDITPTTNNEVRKWFVWVPTPNDRKTYYVAVALYQPRQGEVEVPLDDFNTDKFAGLAAS